MTPEQAPLVVVGDTVLDRDLVGDVERLCPDAPAPVVDEEAEVHRPGGAGLAALLAAAHGRPVTLVTALGDDDAAVAVADRLAEAGIRLIDLGLAGRTPEKVRVRAGRRTMFRLDRGGRRPSPIGALTDAARQAFDEAAAVLVADYGRGLAAAADVRAALAAQVGRTPLVWDPHLRGAPPVPGTWLAVPNEGEAEQLAPGAAEGRSLAGTARRARHLRAAWELRGIAVTRGVEGALFAGDDGAPLVVPVPVRADGDACGAGDCLAAAATAALARHELLSEAVTAGVHAAARFVADGGVARLDVHAGMQVHGTADVVGLAGGAPGGGDVRGAAAVVGAASGGGTSDDVLGHIDRVRAAGGTVVATGGCFDLLHAGHIRLLEHARALGDLLVVCLNSDASVRRLKGGARPLVPEDDRRRVLEAVTAVDAVVVFDEDTPADVLRRLRPDVFVKGGDYAGASLPEADALAPWGGEVVVVPYLDGRSTSRIVEEARRHG